jgi:hypothetical protein
MRTGFRPPGKLANDALNLLMRAERALLRRPPIGTSVMAAATKARASLASYFLVRNRGGKSLLQNHEGGAKGADRELSAGRGEPCSASLLIDEVA